MPHFLLSLSPNLNVFLLYLAQSAAPLSTQFFKSKISKLSLILLFPSLNISSESGSSWFFFISHRNGAPDSLPYNKIIASVSLNYGCFGINFNNWKQLQLRFFLEGTLSDTTIILIFFLKCNNIWNRWKTERERQRKYFKIKNKIESLDSSILHCI